MEDKLSPLEQVKADAVRLTLKRIRDNAEEQGLPVPPRAAHGNTVGPKAEKVEKAAVGAEPEAKPEADAGEVAELKKQLKLERAARTRAENKLNADSGEEAEDEEVEAPEPEETPEPDSKKEGKK